MTLVTNFMTLKNAVTNVITLQNAITIVTLKNAVTNFIDPLKMRTMRCPPKSQ